MKSKERNGYLISGSKTFYTIRKKNFSEVLSQWHGVPSRNVQYNPFELWQVHHYMLAQICVRRALGGDSSYRHELTSKTICYLIYLVFFKHLFFRLFLSICSLVFFLNICSFVIFYWMICQFFKETAMSIFERVTFSWNKQRPFL